MPTMSTSAFGGKADIPEPFPMSFASPTIMLRLVMEADGNDFAVQEILQKVN